MSSQHTLKRGGFSLIGSQIFKEACASKWIIEHTVKRYISTGQFSGQLPCKAVSEHDIAVPIGLYHSTSHIFQNSLVEIFQVSQSADIFRIRHFFGQYGLYRVYEMIVIKIRPPALISLPDQQEPKPSPFV